MTLSAPDRARVGDPVPIVLRLRSTSQDDIEVHFAGRSIAFDITVKNEQGAVVWQRLAGAVIPAILQIRTLTPGQVVELRDQWQPDAPGRYALQGTVPLIEPRTMRTAWGSIEVR